jgi:hypothetical protein
VSEPSVGFWATIVKFVGQAIVTPTKWLLWRTRIATLSVAETVLDLLKLGLVSDIRRIKEADLQTIEAEKDEKKATAQLRLAEAQEASNRATLAKRKDVLAQAEKAKKAAEAAKVQAEADAIRMDAETRRIRAVTEGQARLLESISRLRQEGGDVYFREENLVEILRLELPAPEKDESQQEPPTEEDDTT